MTADDLRRKFLRRLVGLQKYKRWEAFGIVAFFLASILVSIYAGHFLVSQGLSVLTIVGSIALAVFIGTRLRGLNNIVHECSHASFAEDRADNTLIGSFCASVNLGCFKDYKEEHLTHHAHIGDYEHDLDLQSIEALGLHDPLTPRTLARHIITPLIGRHLPYYLSWNLSRKDGLGFQVMKMSLLLAAVVFAALDPLTFLLFVLIPYIWVFPSLNYWADCFDHAGLVGAEDDIDASRNILAPSPVKLLFFPRNDCFHLVHHLFPNVPARHLETAHELLEQDDIYQSKQNASGLWASKSAGKIGRETAV